MAASNPALQSVPEPHIHALGETCPMCEQPIPNEKAREVRARAAAQQRSADDAASARANKQIAAEKERLEAEANARFEELRKQKDSALETAAAESAARVEAARTEARKAAEAAHREQVANAVKAKDAAEASAAQKVAEAETQREQVLTQLKTAQGEKAELEAAATAKAEELRKEKEKALEEAAVVAEAARAEGRKSAEAALREKIAESQTAKAEAERSAAQKIAAADTKAQQALAELQASKAEQEERVSERVQEAREALDKDKAEALAAAKAANDAETRKLTDELDAMRRKLEKQRAVELGEGAEVKLFDALKAEFPGDDIRRVPRGASGADILHTVVNNGQDCGTIIYDSKNTGAWRNDYVAKLIQDQTAAKADHAVLSTLKFPAGASQLEVRDGVVVVNPARAVTIVGLIRRQMLHVHTLRLSKAGRTDKMASLYDFITSERCAHLLGRIDTESDALLDLQTAEVRAHQNHWKKQGTLVRSLQKAKAELDVEIGSIIETPAAAGASS